MSECESCQQGKLQLQLHLEQLEFALLATVANHSAQIKCSPDV